MTIWKIGDATCVYQVGERVQLGGGDLLCGLRIVASNETARELRETQQARQYVGNSDAALGKLRVAVLHQLAVGAQGGGFQIHALHDVRRLRQVEALGLGRAESNAVQLFREFRLHAPLHHRRVVAIAHHVEVAVAEQVEAVAVDRRVGEFVLAEHVDGLVGDDRAGEQQAVFRLRAQPVQRPARGDVVGLDLVALVADDAVRLPCGQLLLQAPRGFVVHHQYLQGGPVHVADGIGLARAGAGEHGEVVVESGEAFKLVLPHAEDGQRRDHQQAADVAA